MKSLVTMLVLCVFTAANAADYKVKPFNEKSWKDMTAQEKQESMDRLKALNGVMTDKALRDGGFVINKTDTNPGIPSIEKYNSKFNPSFQQEANTVLNHWKKLQVEHPKYKHNAWLGEF